VPFLRYDAMNAELLDEFLKERGKVEKLERTIAHQQKQIEVLTAGPSESDRPARSEQGCTTSGSE
jgi:hypothetical protein